MSNNVDLLTIQVEGISFSSGVNCSIVCRSAVTVGNVLFSIGSINCSLAAIRLVGAGASIGRLLFVWSSGVLFDAGVNSSTVLDRSIKCSICTSIATTVIIQYQSTRIRQSREVPATRLREYRHVSIAIPKLYCRDWKVLIHCLEVNRCLYYSIFIYR